MNNNWLQAICLTDIGGRSRNEDNYLFKNQYVASPIMRNYIGNKTDTSTDEFSVRFYAVADGMGGHNAGEVASRICVEELADVERKVQPLSSMKEIVRYVQSSIALINTKICALGRSHMKLKGMGTTLVMLIAHGSEFAILNIGDSRAYHFNGRSLTQFTKDHTEGQRMLDLGLLSRKELAEFPAKKFLSRYIGYDRQGFILQADEYYPVLDGGIILLCSDGVTDFLTDEQIFDTFSFNKDIEIAGRRLIKQAAEQPNADNATAILIQIGG